MTTAQLGDRVLFYERRGTGAPLLLIQGMAGHHKIWGEPLLSGLARDYDVVAYDHRGVGESTDVEGAFTIADLAEDAVRLMDELGWASAHVFGISLGGMVAQELALNHPDRVRTLVLGCTYAGGAGATLTGPGPMMMFEAMQTGDADRAARAGFDANFSAAYTADESRFLPFRDLALGVRLPVPVIMRQAQAAFVHDTSARLPSLTVPTLVMHGTEDLVIPYSNGPLITKLIPDSELVTLEGAGHLFWWERPDETLAAIRHHCR